MTSSDSTNRAGRGSGCWLVDIGTRLPAKSRGNYLVRVTGISPNREVSPGDRLAFAAGKRGVVAFGTIGRVQRSDGRPLTRRAKIKLSVERRFIERPITWASVASQFSARYVQQFLQSQVAAPGSITGLSSQQWEALEQAYEARGQTLTIADKVTGSGASTFEIAVGPESSRNAQIAIEYKEGSAGYDEHGSHRYWITASPRLTNRMRRQSEETFTRRLTYEGGDIKPRDPIASVNPRRQTVSFGYVVGVSPGGTQRSGRSIRVTIFDATDVPPVPLPPFDQRSSLDFLRRHLQPRSSLIGRLVELNPMEWAALTDSVRPGMPSDDDTERDEPQPARPADPAPLGVIYRQEKESLDVRVDIVRSEFEVDHSIRAAIAHQRVQNKLARLIEAAGLEPRSPRPEDPQFDLGFTFGSDVVVIEVKSITSDNEFDQLRKGLGQICYYATRLRIEYSARVFPVLFVERLPDDTIWQRVCNDGGVILAAPTTVDVIPGLAGLAWPESVDN